MVGYLDWSDRAALWLVNQAITFLSALESDQQEVSTQ